MKDLSRIEYEVHVDAMGATNVSITLIKNLKSAVILEILDINHSYLLIYRTGSVWFVGMF